MVGGIENSHLTLNPQTEETVSLIKLFDKRFLLTGSPPWRTSEALSQARQRALPPSQLLPTSGGGGGAASPPLSKSLAR
jgi:hypothetical protein